MQPTNRQIMENPRLKQKYQKEVAAKLAEEFEIKNPQAIPAVKKVTVNMGIGEISKSKELKESLTKDLSQITGQKPSVRLAKVSIATFGLRRGMPVGLSVTLRGEKMWSFLDKFISVVLPRLRDFRGVSKKSFDTRGNYSIGLSEHTVFPEIDFGKVASPRGIEVTITTSAGSPERGLRLMELLGMPFEKEQ